jgi:hypothetical protein
MVSIQSALLSKAHGSQSSPENVIPLPAAKALTCETVEGVDWAIYAVHGCWYRLHGSGFADALIGCVAGAFPSYRTDVAYT